MSLGPRDQEAFDALGARTFADAAVVTLSLEMQARRLTVALYGALRPGDATTYLGTATFFGASAIAVDNAAAAFPESARVTELALDYRAAEEEGVARLAGRRAWSLSWQFDGLAYEEHPAVLASLADDA